MCDVCVLGLRRLEWKAARRTLLLLVCIAVSNALERLFCLLAVTKATTAPVHEWPQSAFNPSYNALGLMFAKNYTMTGVVYEVGQAEYDNTVSRACTGCRGAPGTH